MVDCLLPPSLFLEHGRCLTVEPNELLRVTFGETLLKELPEQRMITVMEPLRRDGREEQVAPLYLSQKLARLLDGEQPIAELRLNLFENTRLE